MTHQPSLEMKSVTAEMSVRKAGLPEETAPDITSAGGKAKKVGEKMLLWDTAVLRHNQLFLTSKQHLEGLKLLKLMTQCLISSHICSTHHTHIISHKLEITNWFLQQRRETSQHPLGFLFGGISGNKRRLSIVWRWTSMHTYTQAHSSLRCTVKCFSGWQGHLSCIHRSTVTRWWQTAVRMLLLFTGDSHSKQRSLAASPFSTQTHTHSHTQSR